MKIKYKVLPPGTHSFLILIYDTTGNIKDTQKQVCRPRRLNILFVGLWFLLVWLIWGGVTVVYSKILAKSAPDYWGRQFDPGPGQEAAGMFKVMADWSSDELNTFLCLRFSSCATNTCPVTAVNVVSLWCTLVFIGFCAWKETKTRQRSSKFSLADSVNRL